MPASGCAGTRTSSSDEEVTLERRHDLLHNARSLSAEEHDARGTSGIEPDSLPLSGAIVRELLIEPGPQNHPDVAKILSGEYPMLLA